MLVGEEVQFVLFRNAVAFVEFVALALHKGRNGGSDGALEGCTDTDGL